MASRNPRRGRPAPVRLALAAVSILIISALCLSACSGGRNAPDITPTPGAQPPTPEVITPATTPSPAPTPLPTPSPTPEPEPSAPSPYAPGGARTPSGETAASVGAGLSITVPESAPVDNDYFSDAVFVGDSRTEGLRMYSGLTNATFFSGVGLTVTKVFSDQIVTLNGQSLTVADALKQASYSKVYIMLGMNELGWVYESVFADDYGKIIDVIRESHPDAVIYVQSILPVSQWKDSSNDIYTNANVVRLQKALCSMCEEKGVHYLNVAEAVQDSLGYLPSDATPDGMHLTAAYCKIWTEYLKTHTV